MNKNARTAFRDPGARRWLSAAGISLVWIVAAILTTFLLRGAVDFVQAAASTPGAPAVPALSRVELANRCTLQIKGSRVEGTAPDGRALCGLELAGPCDATATLNQGDGIHVFLGSHGPRGQTLTVLRVTPHGTRVVLRRTLGDGTWTLEDRTLLVFAHAASSRPSERLAWNGRAYDVARDSRLWR